jgi:hypothetical protein
MDAKLYFGKVHIVEWLRPGDRRTGSELLDELEPLGIVSKPQVLTHLHRVATRADFLGVLRGIEDEFRATARCRWCTSKPTATMTGSVCRTRKDSPSTN